MNRAIHPWILVAALLGAAVGNALAADNDAYSKPVSFQYLNSLDDTPATSPIVSKIVSYQYFDWPGDENVTFQNSPAVSFYFGGGITLALNGMVKDSAGIPISGAQVSLLRYNSIFWQGNTSASGSLPSATLPAGNFNVKVSKPGFTTLLESVPGDAGGPVFLNLTLHPTLRLPTLTTVNRIPASTAIRQSDSVPIPGVRATNLRVFNGNVFSSTGIINPNRMTIAISHGWNPLGGNALSSSSWATEMAGNILSKHSLGSSAPNIVAWDWSVKAFRPLPETDEAAIQGENFGKALLAELGQGYHQRVHFIGHSLGTIVNSYACDYLHGKLPRQPVSFWDKTETKPHVTLLDQAELANVFGSNLTTSTASAWFDSQSRSQLFDVVKGRPEAEPGYKSPFPESAAWMDNYITIAGLYHSRAVNVKLPRKSLTPWGAHEDSHQWYRQSIQEINPLHTMGFARAYESSLVMPPTGNGVSAGSVWQDIPTTADQFDMTLSTTPELFALDATVMRATAALTGTAVSTLSSGGQGVLNGYEAGLKWVGDLGGTTIIKTGQVAASVNEKIGNGWDVALDLVSTINPEVRFLGNIVVPSLKLLLSTPVQGPSLRSVRSNPSASPPQAWIPLQVPTDAAFLVFDFTVTGDPSEDQIVCAINEKNLLTLPARFAPDGSPVSTDFLDISAYAGQQVEIYFGLVGGTSSGCTLAIDGIRFVTVPIPKLSATTVGDQVRLQWPAAATGWIPQRNPGLAPEGWEDVTLPETVTTVDGVVTLERPRLPAKEFFRLRRAE